VDNIKRITKRREMEGERVGKWRDGEREGGEGEGGREVEGGHLLLIILFLMCRAHHKKIRVLERGETLIEIPYWWDGTKERYFFTLFFYNFLFLLFLVCFFFFSLVKINLFNYVV
jgi:hypothetical protein